MRVHGSNLRQKELHKTKYRDDVSREYLKQIRAEYDRWRKANEELIGPRKQTSDDDSDLKTVEARVKLLEDYKKFIDQREYAEKFDSRSNLHSSVLEEFMYYLFRDLVADFGSNTLIGKTEAFKDLFFAPASYAEMLRSPHVQIERKDHDFVIGTTIQGFFRTTTPIAKKDDSSPVTEAIDDALEELVSTKQEKEAAEPADAANSESESKYVTIVAEEPVDYDDPTTTKGVKAEVFGVPAIVIECKTYLDKTMLEGSSKAAEELKARNPNGLYIVAMEYIKLTGKVNLRKYKLDQIYVLRHQRNTDREFHYDTDWMQKPIDPDVVWHMYNLVRHHLITRWVVGGIDDGIERGWLL